MQFRFVIIGVVCVLASVCASAGPADVPRILAVGDSWSAFMQLFRCFEVAFRDYPGLTGIGQRGSQTTLVGGRAQEFNSPAWLGKIQAELLAYPTIDIVHLSLGGNDFIQDSGWNPGMTPPQVQAIIDGINAHTEAVMDSILAIRPNIRIALCGYDFGNHSMGGATIAQMNAVWVQFEQSRLALVQGKSRVWYIHNLGLMQYSYGIPLASIPAHSVPYPGGYAQNYVPMPGGNPNYNTPLVALMDQDMHLTMPGYDILARRCVDEFYGGWLAWPVVLEVLPLAKAAKTPLQQFRVTFSKPVTGVDVNDFAATAAKAVSVVSVSGSGAVYTVTVDLAGASGPSYLMVLDDDSIIDVQGKPLGGVGPGNGGFDHNGPMSHCDPALAGSDDFNGAMLSLDRTFASVAWMLGGQSFAPEHCDANGGTITIEPVAIVGNQMLDAAELGLIYACLHHESLDLSGTGGVTHAVVDAAWQHNIARVTSDLGGLNGRVLTAIPGLESIMGGYMTLGDSASTVVPVLLMTGISGFIQMPPGVSIPSPGNYTVLYQYFGPEGDADGDGFTNRQEYAYFMPIGGVDLYVKAALDTAMTPELRCENTEGGTYAERTPFCLAVSGPVDLGGGFAWMKNGQVLSNDAVLSGSQWRELHIEKLRLSDAGDYECVYDHGLKTFGPVTLQVEPQPVPAAGACGLAMLALAIASAGVWRQRRIVINSR